MRILHCPADVGGNAWGLSQAERELGHHSQVMVFQSSEFGYPNDIDLRIQHTPKLLRLGKTAAFFARAAASYDVFHFNWGTSLLDFRARDRHLVDLPMLKSLGKRVVVTFQGCDARMKGESRGRYAVAACHTCDIVECDAKLDRERARRIEKINKYADHVFVLNPDLMRFVPGAELLLYSSVDPREWQPSTVERDSRPVRVLHLPTNRAIKGTPHVLEACERLRDGGIEFELELLEGVPHAEVRKRMAAADIVIDQLLIGWYGAVAVEAMALGKPVLCFLRPEDLDDFVPFKDEVPIVRTTPGSLAEDLKRLLTDPELRRTTGELGREYVERYHDPLKIAKQVIARY